MDNQQLVQFLNQLLSNYYVMAVKFRRYHWYVKGSPFFQLHEHFAEMYKQFDAHIDLIAKRIFAIGGRPLATMIKFVKEASLDEATADDEIVEMMEQLVKDFSQMIEEMKSIGLKRTNEFKDEATAALLVSQINFLETHIWQFKAYSKMD